MGVGSCIRALNQNLQAAAHAGGADAFFRHGIHNRLAGAEGIVARLGIRQQDIARHRDAPRHALFHHQYTLGRELLDGEIGAEGVFLAIHDMRFLDSERNRQGDVHQIGGIKVRHAHQHIGHCRIPLCAE
ncbi:MAG: hypothetical protein K0R10_1172, partial [Alphaproteobacteria bacterium]|nr:hypothetical protein [Alphaproteobacteria bacterium]